MLGEDLRKTQRYVAGRRAWWMHFVGMWLDELAKPQPDNEKLVNLAAIVRRRGESIRQWEDHIARLMAGGGRP